MKTCPACNIELPEEMVPKRVAVDAILMKLSEAQPGDVLVLRTENYGEGRQLSEQLARVKMPRFSLPPGGVSILIAPLETTWTLQHLDALKAQVDQLLKLREEHLAAVPTVALPAAED